MLISLVITHSLRATASITGNTLHYMRMITYNPVLRLTDI